MNSSREDSASTSNEFLRLYLQDLDNAAPRSLAHYQAQFPDHRDLIADEYARLSAEQHASEALELEPALAFELRDGAHFGAYRLLRRLGAGGQGSVYLAFDASLGRQVALKLLTRASAFSKDALERFRREAQVASRLDDPGICTVHETGDVRGLPYIAMRYVEGETLASLLEAASKARALEQGPPHLVLTSVDAAGADVAGELQRIVQLIERMARSLYHAHEAGVVHRDVKPGNAIIGRDGLPVLVDFGLAGVLDRSLATITRTGEVFGTPAYMAPEQLGVSGVTADHRADLYSLGVVLYECLTLHRPFEADTSEGLYRAILDGAPTDARRFHPGLPEDLRTILEVALQRDPERRYPTAAAMAEDLRRFRAHEPILAHAPSQMYRFRKLVRRNRAIAAAFAASSLVLAAATALTAKEMLAAERERDVAEARAEEVLRLSAFQDLEELIARADDLWPAHPEQTDALAMWLTDAGKLVGALPGLAKTLAELRARALAATDEEQAGQRERSPLLSEIETVKQRLAFLRRQESNFSAPALREDPSPAEVDVNKDVVPFDGIDGLNAPAWQLIDPDRASWGGEERALVLARWAVELAAELPAARRSILRDTLAWALFANGRFQEALDEEQKALTEASPEATPALQSYLDRLRNEIAEYASVAGGRRRAELIASLERGASELEQAVEERATWSFAASQDRWWHAQLTKLVARLEAFADPDTGLLTGKSPEHGWGVQRRLEWSKACRARTLEDAEAMSRWAQATASIRDECLPYAGLELAPQLGLVPIGRDFDSGLWEFAHLQTGAPAQRGPDGKLILTEDTGLVLILIPGATYWMGAQSSDARGRNYDPLATSQQSPVVAVPLAPFFLSKYEMTQGQWIRCTGSNPSRDNPRIYSKRYNARGALADLVQPVADVDWIRCDELMRRLDLVLPTEAQWEYAARAGMGTCWWTGDDPRSLAGAANLADRYAEENGAEIFPTEDWLDDGNTAAARVGSYRANAFGLHDVIGNVEEWCRDGFSDYELSCEPLDGERIVPNPRTRLLRGGDFLDKSDLARSAFREMGLPYFRNVTIGVRPARKITSQGAVFKGSR